MGGLRARTDQRGGACDTPLWADIADEAGYRLAVVTRGLTGVDSNDPARPPRGPGGSGDTRAVTSGLLDGGAVGRVAGEAVTARDACIAGGFPNAAAMAGALADGIMALAEAPPPARAGLVAELLSMVEAFGPVLAGLRAGRDAGRPPVQPAMPVGPVGRVDPAGRVEQVEREPARPPEPAEPAEVEPAGAGPTLLVVEGAVGVRERQREVLEEAGYTVRTAADGLSALTLLRGAAVDLVLVDADMAGMGGIDLTRAIREAPGLAHVGILVLGARVSDELRRRAVQAGADGLVLKSALAERELLGAVARVLHPRPCLLDGTTPSAVTTGPVGGTGPPSGTGALRRSGAA